MAPRSGRLVRSWAWILNHLDHIWIGVLSVFILVALALGCNSLKRIAIIGSSTAVATTAGLAVAGPPGGVAAGTTAAITSAAYVEGDIAEERAERLEDHLAGRPLPPPAPEPPFWERVPLWGWLAGLWAWLRRAHLASAVTGSEPRLDAILRALGLRTHKTPIASKRTSS